MLETATKRPPADLYRIDLVWIVIVKLFYFCFCKRPAAYSYIVDFAQSAITSAIISNIPAVYKTEKKPFFF
jgi:hypothetical protein